MRWKFKKILLALLKANSTPGGIALGTAIGVFIAILPVYGLHTIMVIIAAIIVRPANKVAILLGTNISLPPTVPFITWAGYEIGRLILKGNLPALAMVDFKQINFHKIVTLYPALFLGSVILGVICALIFYFLTFLVVKNIQEKRRRNRNTRHHRQKV